MIDIEFHVPQNDDERMIRRLLLASVDMDLAEQAAKARLSGDIPDLDRLLDTALVVCYARPFKRHGIGLLDKEWAPCNPEPLALHELVIELRDTFYAHTDDTELRGVVDIGKLAGSSPYFGEAYSTGLHPMVLPKIVDICEAQSKRFEAAARALEERLDEKGLASRSSGTRLGQITLIAAWLQSNPHAPSYRSGGPGPSDRGHRSRSKEKRAEAKTETRHDNPLATQGAGGNVRHS